MNPVAVLIGKALVEIPAKFAGLPPVNPSARATAAHGQVRAWKGAQGLAEDVRYYGQWMSEEAAKRIGHLYPRAKLPNGTLATVIAWLWVRTIRSPDPAAKGAMVPLASTFMLSTNGNRKAWLEPIIDQTAQDGYRFEVKTGEISSDTEERLKLGTKTGRGEFACLLSGVPLKDDYIRDRTLAGDGSWRAMAVVAEAKKGKIYLNIDTAPPPEVPKDLISDAPDQLLFKGALGFRVPAYGVLAWGDFFRDRQIAALSVFSQLIAEIPEKLLYDADEAKPYLPDYGKAIGAYLICALGRAVDYWTINTMWEPGGEFIIHTFSEMTIPIVWDSAEGNPFAPGGGGWNKTCLDWVVRVIEALPSPVGFGSVVNVAAQECKPPDYALFSSDPPYFDNIGYADLSDAFYVWERKPLAPIFPELSRRISTPKDSELVATAARHGGPGQARDFFLNGMRSVFDRMHRSASTDPISIYYSFKEKGKVGQGSGWESFLEAIVGPGWQIDASWPLKTERPTRNRSIGKAALASAIVLICRKRPEGAEICTRSDFIRTLKRELPSAVEYIRKAGVSPVDLQQCIIGPGIGVFSRYRRVLEDDDSPMSVKTALLLVNRIWNEIENELDSDFDPETQVALAWFASYGFEPRTSGELITQANAKSLPISALFSTGVFQDLKGKTALTARSELPDGWSPASDRTVTVWECVQHTARVLNAPNGGSEAAARLVAQMGPKAGEARALAYRLFEIATAKGWASEALIYNELAQEWTKLEDVAATLDNAGRPPGSGQSAFTFEASL